MSFLHYIYCLLKWLDVCLGIVGRNPFSLRVFWKDQSHIAYLYKKVSRHFTILARKLM
jgi:hypothetical protein